MGGLVNLYIIEKEMIMDNRSLGAIGVLGFIILAIVFAISQDGVNANIMSFISVPAFGFVVGVGGALTYMKKHQFKDGELGKSLKNEFILAGWLGLIVGLVLMTSSMTNIGDYSISTFISGLGAAQLTVLYGYVLGNIASVLVD